MSTIRSEQIEQPVNLSGSFNGSFSGSFIGTVESASYALTASYIDGYVTNSIYNTFTSSYYIDSASFNYRIENILIPTGSGSSENHPVTVNAATTTVLPRSPLYNNGTNGVGAFLSASISGTLGNIDGVTLTVGDHFLVKNQANSIQNGVYDIVSTGSASGFYLLSRSLFSDETSELDSQIVIPSFGTTNKGGIFAQTTNNPVIGTDNIVYSQQTNTLINQASAGTQAVYQIPWYVSTARQLSKGSPNFKYINVTSGTNITTSSLLLTGSFNISGSLNVTNGITGSLLGTSSYATTASYWSGSINNADSASYATTASYALNNAGGGIENNTTSNINGTYLIDLSVPIGHHILTMTGNTLIDFTNMISATQTLTISLTVFGNYSLSLPSWLKPKSANDSYNGSLRNELVILIKKGGVSPIGYYSLTNEPI